MVSNSHAVPERPGSPIIVAPLALSELVCAGLSKLLEPFHPRVRLLANGATRPYDIGLVEPELLADHWRPPHNRPVVALARIGQVGSGDPTWGWKAADIVRIDASAGELVHRLERVYRQRLESAAQTGLSADGLLRCRESEILARICQGSSNHQIAVELYLSVNSIKSYIRTAYRKMGVQSRTQAVLWGLEHGYGTAQTPEPVVQHPTEVRRTAPVARYSADELTLPPRVRPWSAGRGGSVAGAATPASG